VTVATPADNQVLMYEQATTQWKNKALPAPSISLDALTDVVAPTPTANQTITFDGTTWRNAWYRYADLNYVPSTFPSDWNTMINKPSLKEGVYIPYYIDIWTGGSYNTSSSTWTLNELAAVTDPIRAVQLSLYGVSATAGNTLVIQNGSYNMSRVQINANSLANTPSFCIGEVLLRANRQLTVLINGSWALCYLAITAIVIGQPPA